MIKKEELKIIPLGGLGEIGKNMMTIEYGQDIIAIDTGAGFPGADMPGIDLVIPNMDYFREEKKKIKAVIFTHGHFDHIGALPYMIEKMGYPTLYATALTKALILKRHEEFKHLGKINIEEIKVGKVFKVGCFLFEPLHLNHNIPDAIGVAIKTPVGIIIHTGDFKFDDEPMWNGPADRKRLSELGKKGVLCLFSDSTGAEETGHSISEKAINRNLEEIFKKATGRVIVGTFSSMITRVQQIVWLAEKYGRKIVFDGYSMKTNMEIAKILGYLKIEKGTEINIQRAIELPQEKLVIIGTGALGQDNAVFMRIANGEHRYFKIHKNDSIIFSSSVIPGTERAVQNVKDLFYKQGAKVYHYQMMDIHAGGHAQAEELKEMINLTQPRFLIPVHGYYSMMVTHKDLAKEEGMPEENILTPDNGSIILLNQDKIEISKKTVASSYVLVDGLGIGDVGQVVLRDRQVLAGDGMFVVIAVIDLKTGKVRGNPDIISRGFVYLKEERELLAEVRRRVKHIVETSVTANAPINWIYVRDNIREKIGSYLYQQTQRRPMVLPVVIEV